MKLTPDNLPGLYLRHLCFSYPILRTLRSIQSRLGKQISSRQCTDREYDTVPFLSVVNMRGKRHWNCAINILLAYRSFIGEIDFNKIRSGQI